MTVLLLCGYRKSEPSEITLGVDLIDKRILQLRGLGLNVICVLAGQSADDQLRYCKRIADCELAFDTNDVPTLATNVKAGLAATGGEGCFILPVEVPCPASCHWNDLREDWRRIGFHTDNSVLQMVDAGGAPSHYGFPLIITRKGNALIKELPEFKSLTDMRLKYLQVRHTAKAGLAPDAISL